MGTLEVQVETLVHSSQLNQPAAHRHAAGQSPIETPSQLSLSLVSLIGSGMGPILSWRIMGLSN